MMNVRKIRFRNFLSFGNAWTEVDFVDGKINLVMGENGHGKSSIYEVLFFAFYGKPFRDIKKGGLVNSLNGKELEVEAYLEKASHEYVIRRGIKPDIFEIHIDGKLKDQSASVRDYQSYLEANVLQMDEKTFKQVVILGSDFFVPFMSLSAGERRIVVEDFLNVGVYSVMNQKAKEKISAFTRSIRDLDNKVEILRVKLSMKKEELDRITGKNEGQVTQATEELLTLKNSISDLEEEISKVQVTMSEVDFSKVMSDVKAARDSVSSFKSELAVLQSHVTAHEKESSFFDANQTCPVCTQEISEGFKAQRGKDRSRDVKNIESKRKDRLKSLEESEAALKELDRLLSVYQDASLKMKQLIGSKTSMESSARNIQQNITRLQREMNSDTDTLKAEIKVIAKEGRDLVGQKNLEETEKSHYDAISDLLKDGGIKNRIVKDYLPSINKLIRKYLEVLEFPVTFTFDEDFKETIRARGRDEYTYGNFSAGERMRLDLALLFTWREITRIKSSAYCNVLILDEIGDSSLDAQGFDAFMKILNSDRSKQSVMIISHKPQGISSRVDRVIEVSKRTGFSTFSVTDNDPHEQLL